MPIPIINLSIVNSSLEIRIILLSFWSILNEEQILQIHLDRFWIVKEVVGKKDDGNFVREKEIGC